jgi:enoyl-CoA hydratase/carnithine racemase
MDILNRRTLFAAGAVASTTLFTEGAAIAQNAAPTPLPGPPGRVAVESRGNVLVIGIDRQQAENRLDPSTLLGLGRALYQLEHDDALHAGVLYGKGANFVAGLDVAAFSAALRSGDFPPKDPEWMQPLNLPPVRTKPLVVALHGKTGFVGHELALAADVRVAASNTRFLQGEVARGLFPAGGATVRFTREAGWGNAMRYMLTGDEWSAQDAYRMGLVQEVTPVGRQLDRAIELAVKIAANSPAGVRATLASANRGLAADERAAYAAILPEFRRLLSA